MKTITLVLALLCTLPAHADRRRTGKVLLGVGSLTLVATVVFVGLMAGGLACHDRDGCTGVAATGIYGTAVSAPLTLGLLISGGVLYDLSAPPKTAALMNVYF